MPAKHSIRRGIAHCAMFLCFIDLLTGLAAASPAQARRTDANRQQTTSLATSTTITVTTTADRVDGSVESIDSLHDQPGADGTISLREALLASNRTPLTTTVTIDFGIPISDTGHLSGTWTIRLDADLGNLPPLERGQVTIDGSTQSSTRQPRIVLDGTNGRIVAGGPTKGLIITSAGNIVRGFALTNFYEAGIELSGPGAANNQIQACYIGTDANGMVAQPNRYGIYLGNGAHDNLIGAANAASRNLISGNSFGVAIAGPETQRNTIVGNWIGTNASGQAALANTAYGVYVSDDAHDNLIGAASQGNVISGNGHGVRLDRSHANMIVGNIIGLAADGQTRLGNTNGGIFVVGGARDNLIGGTLPPARNIISANGVPSNPSTPPINGQGIYIDGAGSDNNLVQGNYIGVDITGVLPRGNYRQGVLINNNARANRIGGAEAGAGNVIADNGLGGVRVDAPGNTIARNFIGVGADGVTRLGNNQYNGVRIRGDSNVVGPDNFIAYNRLSGVMLIGNNNSIISNTVRLNDLSGICLQGVSTDRNQISGNRVTNNGGEQGITDDCNVQGGIVISGTNTLVRNNTIHDNVNVGVLIRRGVGNQIIRNSISGNSEIGIQLEPGSNGNIAAPNIRRVTLEAITGTTQCYPCTVEVFSDPDKQGRDYINMVATQPDGSFNLGLTPDALTGAYVTATVTDASGNTSPFALPVKVPPRPLKNRAHLPLIVR